MKGFTLFRRNECPVCAGIKKDCRQSNESGMVFCRESSANPSGFIFRGLDRWGFGLWQPSEAAEAFAQKSKEEWEQEQEQKRINNERLRQQQIASQLPAVERDKFYRKLLAQLPIKQTELCDLESRGFSSEQIKADGYRSVSQWERLSGSFPSNLPGVLANGNLNSQPGCIFPIPDVNGLIVALAIRLTDGSNGRYRWLTSATKKNPNGATPHLDGELPLSVFEPSELQADAIWLTEGVGVKPSLTRYRLGVPVVGASSGLFSGSPNTCKITLQRLSDKYQTQNLIIAVDAGDVQNSHVCQRWVGEFEFLKSLGYELQIAWWGQLHKSDRDIDELDDLSAISFISVEDFVTWAETERRESPQDTFSPNHSRSSRNSSNISKTHTFSPNHSQSNTNSLRAGKPQSRKDNQGSFTVAQSKISITLDQPSFGSLKIPNSKDGDFSKSNNNLANSAGQLSSTKRSGNRTGKRLSEPLPCRGVDFDILNPPLTASFPIQPLRDGISKILPIPESVASCWTTEQKATRKERRWFESVLKRIKKVLLKSDKQPRLGFNCFKEDNPGFEEKIRQVQRKLRSLSYDADIESHQRYLPNELATQLPKSGLIGIKAPKGCGKSVLLKKIIAIAKKQGIPVLSITPRIALGREQAIKWEITWIDDYGTMQTRAGDTAQQIEEVARKRSEARGKLTELESIKHQQLNLLGETEALKLEQQKTDLRIEIERCGQEIENINAASIKTLALCWDSLWRTKDRDLKESLIIIDEAELGFKHFITGSTCKRNRPYLLQTFKDKLSECLMSGGRVILSDADLTDLPINYVREILPIPIKPFIVTNEYIGEETRWIVDFRTGSRGNTLRDIVDAVGDGTYLAITTDSQAEAQALEKLILQDFSDEFCAFLDADGNITEDAQARKKALIVRIDRTTTESEAGKKFIQKPNEQILHWQPRVLIYTPSMGVGVSIDESTQRWDADWEEMVPYFDAVYGLFFGVIEPSQCRQQLSRPRANVPRIVYAKESNRALEGCASFFPDEVKRQTFKYNHSALNILDIAKGMAGYEADDEQIREEMLKLLTESWDKNSRCWKEPSIDLASAFKARENYGLWNLANLLREELEDEGHTIISLKGFKTDLVEQMADIKDELKAEEATLIAQAPTMPLEEAKKVINTLGATKEQKLSAQKTLLQEELPEVNLTPEFVKKAVVDDRRRWLSQNKLFWYLTNTEAVKQIDTEHWLSNLKKFAESTPFMRDIRSHSPKVKALKASGVFDFIQVEGEGISARIYQGDTPEAELFLKRCLKNRDLLQTTLNVLVTKKSSPIGLANRILGKVGLELEKVTKNKSDKRWQLSPKLVNDSDRLAVLKAFELRWQMSQEEAQKNEAQKQAQTHTQNAIQPQGQSPVYIDTNQGCPYPCAVESQGVSEPLAAVPAMPAETLSRVEEVVAMLPYGQDAEDLRLNAAGYSREVMEEAQKNEAQKQAQTHTQKAIQPQGQSPGYIDTDQGCPYPCAVESQGGNEPLAVVPAMPAETLSPVAELTDQPTFEQLVEALPHCHAAEDLATVTQHYQRSDVEKAIALQPEPERFQQMWETVTDARCLRSVTDWHQVTLSQSRLDEAWQLLDATEQNRLHELCQTAQQPVERQWGITRQQAETGGAFEWIRGGLVRVVVAAADFVRLATGDYANYQELRVPG